jgi:hypothetical protein
MFALYLNPVTANAERYIPVATADSYEALIQLLENESLGPNAYHDGHFYRSFREGILHNFNPPMLDGTNCFGVNEGIIEVISREDLIEQQMQELLDYNLHFSEATHIGV